MAITSWFRSWHGAPTDNKWLVIARKANVAPGIVSAVAWALLDYASQAEDRGSVKGFDVETYAVFSGFDEGDIASVIAAMHDKNVIDQNERFTNWGKRQPKREDDSTERVKAHRQRSSADVTQCNAAKRNVTQCNAAEHDVTHGNAREEKRREEKKERRIDTPLPPNGGGGGGGGGDDVPASDGDTVSAEDYALVCSTYEDNIGFISPMIADQIKADLQEYPAGWIVEAIEIAIANNVRKLAYVEGVLERWKREGKSDKRTGNGYNGNGYKRAADPDPFKGKRELT